MLCSYLDLLTLLEQPNYTHWTFHGWSRNKESESEVGTSVIGVDLVCVLGVYSRPRRSEASRISPPNPVHLLPRDTAQRLRLCSGTEQRPEVLRSDRAHLIARVHPRSYHGVCLDAAHQ
jgi:hypothetical protein